MSIEDPGFKIAVEEAKLSFSQGGIPVGAAVVAPDGTVLGRGHNTRVQDGSLIMHGETAAFENAKHLDSSAFAGSTLYTTLSCCPMCAGSIILFKCARVVIGENRNMTGREEYLRSHGIEVVVLDDQECVDLLNKFKTQKPEVWTFDKD